MRKLCIPPRKSLGHEIELHPASRKIDVVTGYTNCGDALPVRVTVAH